MPQPAPVGHDLTSAEADARPAMTPSQRWISLVIVLVIGLHALPIISYQGHRQTRWPFLAWAMYAASFPPGPISTNERWMVGVTASGDTTLLDRETVGVSTPALVKSYLRPLTLGDSAAARRLFERVNGRRREPLVAIRLEGKRSTLTDTGVVVEAYPPITYHLADSARR
jgi:hypothetical protein